MTHKQMHDFASTPEKGLPEHVKKKNASGLRRIRVKRNRDLIPI
jgi:hypothetical protein